MKCDCSRLFLWLSRQLGLDSYFYYQMEKFIPKHQKFKFFLIDNSAATVLSAKYMKAYLQGPLPLNHNYVRITQFGTKLYIN